MEIIRLRLVERLRVAATRTQNGDGLPADPAHVADDNDPHDPPFLRGDQSAMIEGGLAGSPNHATKPMA
jgi:hypothetical protein